ncbi:hypothetical protein OUZ56_012277 [Daphnia magna]|uniref:Uncharacterized protein n=1 Tax=Daphnia magna TaxID=35525 RepID=A0ABQ9Z2I9_9CRUS|nr:hypothetical protein OUZ56_012277 [Daphnia magna]
MNPAGRDRILLDLPWPSGMIHSVIYVKMVDYSVRKISSIVPTVFGCLTENLSTDCRKANCSEELHFHLVEYGWLLNSRVALEEAKCRPVLWAQLYLVEHFNNIRAHRYWMLSETEQNTN